MVRLVTEPFDKVCKHCYGGGLVRMNRLPHMMIYICPNCSGLDYTTITTEDKTEEEEEYD